MYFAERKKKTKRRDFTRTKALPSSGCTELPEGSCDMENITFKIENKKEESDINGNRLTDALMKGLLCRRTWWKRRRRGRSQAKKLNVKNWICKKKDTYRKR